MSGGHIRLRPLTRAKHRTVPRRFKKRHLGESECVCRRPSGIPVSLLHLGEHLPGAFCLGDAGEMRSQGRCPGS